MKTPSNHSGILDFDFFIGDWRVEHRQLKERLAHCSEWAEFGGTTVTRKILGGSGNLDDNVLEHPDGTYRAATLRSFNEGTGTWSIWWLDGRKPGNLDTPMVGRFERGIGTFYADDIFSGKPIRVRFLWTLPAPDKPHWEQAFSADCGESWETNWTMDFARQD